MNCFVRVNVLSTFELTQFDSLCVVYESIVLI